MPSPEHEALREMLAGGPGFEGQPVAEQRETLELFAAQAPDTLSCTPVSAGGVSAEWVCAPGADSNRVLLYLHGGGYVLGSLDSHRELAGRLSEAAGARVLTVDYRLAPEHPFPAALDDALAAWRWLQGQGTLAIAGDSAGGGLALATLLAAREQGLPAPVGYVGLSPWLDLEGSGRVLGPDAALDPMLTLHGLDWSAELYARGALTDPLVSPLFAELRGLPPLLLQVGTADILCSDSERLAERAQAAGVPVTLEVEPGLIHVWHTHGGLPESQAALARIGVFLRARWEQSAVAERPRPS